MVHLKQLDSISIAKHQDAINEDCIITGDNFFVVMDGATGLGDPISSAEKSDAAIFVEIIGTFLENNLASYGSFIKALADAINEAIAYFKRFTEFTDLPAYRYPSAGMSAVFLKNNLCEIYRTGDCLAYFSRNLSTKNLFQSSPLEKLDKKSTTMLLSHLRSGKPYNVARKIIEPTLKKHRALMNKPSGYGALTVDLGCLEYIEKATIKLIDGDQFLLCSDGFSASFLNYNLFEIAQIKPSSLQPLKRLAEKIREIEHQDSKLIKFPRLKPSDDLSAIIIIAEQDK